MANIYFNSNNPLAGDGTSGNPYKSLASYTASDNDVLILESNAIFYEGLTDTQINAVNITVTSSGLEPAILDGSVAVSTWATTGIPGIFSYTIGSNNGGNITENGVPMQAIVWTTNIATTAPFMFPGTFTNDYVNGIIYIRPTQENVDLNTYRVSVIQHGLQSTTTRNGLTFNNIKFQQFSRHGLQLLNKSNVNVRNCIFNIIGGYASGGTYVGNGIEYGPGCVNGEIFNNTFYDIFDSPITTQLYTNSTFVRNIKIYKNKIYRGGLFGIEITNIGAVTNCQQTNIEVFDNIIKDMGYNWRQTGVTARAIVVGGGQATSTWINIYIHDNLCENNLWGLSDGTGGSTCFGVVFERNWVVFKRPALRNNRGIYTNNSNVFRANHIDGHFYGVVLFGSSSSVRYTFHNNNFINCVEALAWDGTGTPTVELRNNLFWTNGGRFYRVIIAATLIFDINYNAIREGITLGGPVLGPNDVRPTTLELSTTYLPILDSLIYSGGTSSVGKFKDLNNKYFNTIPSIGAFELTI